MDLTRQTRGLFEGPNFAHVATLMPDGSPHVAAIWIAIEGDHLMFVKEPGAVALGNLRRDPRVAISVVSVEDPYIGAHVRGRAVEFGEGLEATGLVNALALKYTGKPYPDADTPLVLVVVEVEHGGSRRAGDFEHTPPGAQLQLPRSTA